MKFEIGQILIPGESGTSKVRWQLVKIVNNKEGQFRYLFGESGQPFTSPKDYVTTLRLDSDWTLDPEYAVKQKFNEDLRNLISE